MSGVELSIPQRDLLWRVAQHRYCWTYISRGRGQLQVADALVSRGLVQYGQGGREQLEPSIEATAMGRLEIKERWPISPFARNTYDHQPGGWQMPDGAQRFASTEEGS